MKKWLAAALGIIVMLTVLLTGCPKKAPETVKIGAIFAYTGGASFLGLPEKKTVEMLVDGRLKCQIKRQRFHIRKGQNLRCISAPDAASRINPVVGIGQTCPS